MDIKLRDALHHLFQNMEAIVEEIERIKVQVARIKAQVANAIHDIDQLKTRPSLSAQDQADLAQIATDLSAEADQLAADDIPDDVQPPAPPATPAP